MKKLKKETTLKNYRDIFEIRNWDTMEETFVDNSDVEVTFLNLSKTEDLFKIRCFLDEDGEVESKEVLYEFGNDGILENKIYNIDAITLLEQIYEEYGEESVDMFLCDLPYTFEGKKRVTANKWDLPIDMDKFWELTTKLLTKTGVVALTATQPFSSYLVMSNTPMFKFEWIWEKDNGSNFVHVKHQPFRVHESTLIFGKAPTTYNKNGLYMEYNPQMTQGSPYKIKRNGDVENLAGFKGRTDTNNDDGLRYPRSVQKFNLERGLHPTQKPTDWFEYLIKTHSKEGGLIVDLTAGSGTTAIASIRSNRKYMVNDLLKKYYDIMVQRIHEENSDDKLKY